MSSSTPSRRATNAYRRSSSFYTSYPSIKTNAPVVFKNHYIYKWFDSTAIRNTAKADLNYTLYRLADVYLLYAEASNRAEGSPNVNAINYVNAIRQRANLAPLGALSQTAFEQEVWLQRYFELCFENKMWFDMIRTLKVHNDVTGNWDDFVGHKNGIQRHLHRQPITLPAAQKRNGYQSEIAAQQSRVLNIHD